MDVEHPAEEYASKSDEELLQLALNPEQLTPEANVALSGELSKRGIAIPEGRTWLREREQEQKIERDTDPLRALTFAGLVAINIIVAVLGTAFLGGALRRAIPPLSITAVVLREYIVSILGAVSLGFSVWRLWRNSAAQWTWVLPAAWFTFGVLVLAAQRNVFGQLSGFGIRRSSGAAEVSSFFLFTVPFVRSVSYSLGAYVSSLLYPAGAPHLAASKPQ